MRNDGDDGDLAIWRFGDSDSVRIGQTSHGIGRNEGIIQTRGGCESRESSPTGFHGCPRLADLVLVRARMFVSRFSFEG